MAGQGSDSPAAQQAADGHRPAAITVAGLTKNYGEIEAVRGIDFEVPVGETFGFLGPNGAGKSTTIKMLCTLAVPTLLATSSHGARTSSACAVTYSRPSSVSA